MSQQKRNPKIEWGFFAVVPRVVRTQYKELTHADKWLYTCLKDLCGDKGTCFRTLRALKEETDISIASLSAMIPKLHDAGLIHAEKKRRSNSGKEVWHITIVDIWQSNKEYCSKIEQSPDEIVQNLNNNVQNLNKEAEVCSNIERDCSNFGYRRTTLEEQHIEERTVEEESTATANADRNALTQTDTLKEQIREKLTDPRLRAATVEMIASEDEDDLEAPTEKLPVVQKPDAGTPPRVATPPGSDQVDTSVQASSCPPSSEPLGEMSEPAQPPTAQASVIPKRPRGKKPIVMEEPPAVPQMPSVDAQWGTRTCMQMFDAWRGVTLIGKWKNSQASECAKGLAERYSREYVEAAKEVMGADKYYVERGGCDICDVANNIHKYKNKILRRLGAMPENKAKPQSRPTLDEVECVDPTWCVYKRPGDGQEWILWQGELMTEDEANERGYAGGGGLYIQTQYA